MTQSGFHTPPGTWNVPGPFNASLIAAAIFALLSLAGSNQAQAQGYGKPAALLPGAGKQLVEGVCTGCHQTDRIPRSSGYTRDGWQELAATMIDLSAAPADRATIVQYLATHYPPKKQRGAKLISGKVQISFKEWVRPTLGQRSRDPIQAADGTIWWAGQRGNLIGRIDPATGATKEYMLPANSMPHSVTLDAKGNVWYTGNANGTVGYLDPKTEKITVYRMPDPAAKDPHTPIFDKKRIHWFTLQQSNMLGRLDPKTGDIKLPKMKTPRAKPYGIKIDADGNPWVACNGSNCLVKVDPKTETFQSWAIPSGGIHAGIVRHMRPTRDGNLLIHQSSTNRIILVTIKRRAASR